MVSSAMIRPFWLTSRRSAVMSVTTPLTVLVTFQPVNFSCSFGVAVITSPFAAVVTSASFRVTVQSTAFT